MYVRENCGRQENNGVPRLNQRQLLHALTQTASESLIHHNKASSTHLHHPSLMTPGVYIEACLNRI